MGRGEQFAVDYCPMDLTLRPPQPLYWRDTGNLTRGYIAGELAEGRLPNGIRLIDWHGDYWMAYTFPTEQVLIEVERLERDSDVFVIPLPARVLRPDANALTLLESTDFPEVDEA